MIQIIFGKRGSGKTKRIIDMANASIAEQKGIELVLEQLQPYESNLVQIGENVREHPAFICNCCGCCCEAEQESILCCVRRVCHIDRRYGSGTHCAGVR